MIYRQILDCLCACAIGAAALSFVTNAEAQASLPVYTDNLVNGFQDWSWASHNLANTSPTHTGSRSISVSDVAWTALSFEHPDFNTTPYTNLIFWAHGGTSGGQQVEVYVQYGSGSGPTYVLPTVLPANSWQQFAIPLSTLGVANRTNVYRINIELTGGGTTNTFYVDDVQLGAAPAPALAHLSVNASDTLRLADPRWSGVNTATWDGSLGNSQTLPLLREAGCLTLRWPGGSTSDGYHWYNDLNNNNTFNNTATNLGANVFITANYGSGTSNEAAAWVKWVNVTNHCGFKYWEIGNECYGTWETDYNTPAHDPYTYAVRAAGYIALMKAADPTIKIGVVIVPGEDTFDNGGTNFAVNPRTGTTNYGWTPVMLTTLKNLGVTPDFAIYHFYPQYTPTNWPPNSPDSDPLLLQVAVNWAGDAADMRQQITDYIGPAGTNIELVCTENNSDSGAMGRQSTSIVNALYLADSASQLMKTEFNAYLWWDLHNGADTQGDFDPTLYGWRSNGDYGLLDTANAPYPTFYAEKLLQYFVRPGDTVLDAASDYLLLSAYAVRKADGALDLLVINKDATASFNAQISLSNFTPSSTAMARSYGIAQDDAVRTNNLAPGAQDIATNFATVGAVFTNSFPPYSLTLFTFAPAPSQLSALVPQPDQFVLQVQGQPGTPYVIQSSPDLFTWTSIATNTQAGNFLNVTNAISPGISQQFWRAVWQP
ncbi:MAG: alpha-L-arabinofuranosidase [Verrucomicrobiia bacterium]